MASRITRRQMLRHAGTTTAAALAGPIVRAASPNEKLNIAGVGVTGRGAADLLGVSSENIVALCDVDEEKLAKAAKRYTGAKKWRDYRQMLDKQKDYDAVVVATPDHHHAFASVRAMELGKHVYCEKPLAHDVYQVRRMTEAARRNKVATQMGTQIHSRNNYRRVVELIRAGAIGPVREVRVSKGGGVTGGEIPDKDHEVPSTLDWDLWIGPSEHRPYHPGIYHPGDWRGWWDFGTGTLGDFGCHYMDVAFWALDLKHPMTVTPEPPSSSPRLKPPKPERTPTSLVVHYAFPARGDQPPVTMTWAHGMPRPKEHNGVPLPDWSGNSVLFIGDDGLLITNYGKHKLLPKEKFADYERPEKSIPPSPGHHEEWIRACKGGPQALCHFGYGGPLTETALLGNVAYRLEKKLAWNPNTLEAYNAAGADALIHEDYRKGWKL